METASAVLDITWRSTKLECTPVTPVMLAPTVVAVAREIDLDRSGLTLPRSPRDPDRVAHLARTHGLESPTERLTKVLTG